MLAIRASAVDMVSTEVLMVHASSVQSVVAARPDACLSAARDNRLGRVTCGADGALRVVRKALLDLPDIELMAKVETEAEVAGEAGAVDRWSVVVTGMGLQVVSGVWGQGEAVP